MAGARYMLFSRQIGTRPGVNWRLVVSNNREIARAVHPSATLDALVEALEEIRICAPTAPARFIREPASLVAPAGWRWQLDVAGRCVAASSRVYQRRIGCEVALAQFRDVAPTAVAELGLKA